MNDETIRISIAARDERFLRAAGDVARRYKIVRRPAKAKDAAVFDVRGGQKPYVVRVHPEWATPPSCTCPDAIGRARGATAGYCKHIIAVLLKHDEFKHQLLEVFL